MNNPHELTEEELEYIKECWDAAENCCIND